MKIIIFFHFSNKWTNYVIVEVYSSVFLSWRTSCAYLSWCKLVLALLRNRKIFYNSKLSCIIIFFLRYEEENFTRLTLTKKEQKSLQQIATAGNIRDELLGYKGFTAVERKRKRKQNSKSKGKLLLINYPNWDC